MASLQQVIQNQERELNFYNARKNQIQSNRNLALQLQKEERNFGFKSHFDTQGNSNLAERIGRAERGGASDEDIGIILTEHDYVRDAMLSPMDPMVPIDPIRPRAPTARWRWPPGHRLRGASTPSSSAGAPTVAPKKHDTPARPDKTPTKIVKKAGEKAVSLVDTLMKNLPLVILVICLLFFIYKVFYSPLKGSKGKKGKGKKK